MPVDQRLRDGLRQAVDGIEPDVERRLEEVVAARRSRRRVTWPDAVLPATSTVVVLAVVVTIAVLTLREPSRHAEQRATVRPMATVTGTYRAVVRSGPPSGRGEWVVLIYPTSMSVVGPRFSTDGPVSSNPTLVTTSVFSAQCGAARGSYAWRMSAPSPGMPRPLTGHTWRAVKTDGVRLALSALHDSCPFRRAVLGRSWLHLLSVHG